MLNIEPLHRLKQDPEWVELSNVLKEHISKLLNINDIDTTLSGDDLKIELRARKLAVDNLIEFYNNNLYTKLQSENIKPRFN